MPAITRPLLLVIALLAVAVQGRRRGLLQATTAPGGIGLVNITCFLDPADGAVLGFQTVNGDGTTDEECLPPTPNAITKTLTFKDRVRKVIVTHWLNKRTYAPERLGQLTFETKGKKLSCGQRRPKGQLGNLVVWRGTAKAPAKNMTLSALAADICGPPRGFTIFWSPINNCGGFGSGGKKGRSLQLSSCPGERLAAILSKQLFEAMFPMRNAQECSRSLNVPAGEAYPYRVCYTRFCPQGTVWRDYTYNNGDPIAVSAPFGPTYAAQQYEYDTLIEAARSFPTFLSSPDETVRKRELAAFLAQISHETTGIGYNEPNPPYNGLGGLCHREEGPGGDCSIDGACATWPPPVGYVGGCCPEAIPPRVRQPMSTYCTQPNPVPCAPGKKYFGRGAKQLSYQYNYKAFGDACAVPHLVENPDKVITDRILPLKTALWFWVTPQYNKPSCASVMQGTYTPNAADIAANRTNGFGTTTNIINGGVECPPEVPYGTITDPQRSRIRYYETYCQMLGVDPGSGPISCAYQKDYNH